MAEEENKDKAEGAESAAEEKAEEATEATEEAEATEATGADESAEAAETPEAKEEAAPKGKKNSEKDGLDPKLKKNIVSGYVPGEPKKGIAEQIRIIKERRLLRKDLKSKGITKRKDFEEIAEALGLVLWKCHPFFIWWHHAFKALVSGIGLKWLLGAAAAGLATMFLISTITEAKGSFTINLTGDMLKDSYTLSETSDFANPLSRLFAERLENVNNITFEDIDEDVDKIDGAHNGQNYFAYTFYIKSAGKDPSSYAWYFKLKDETLSVSNAVWIMVFQDGKQMLYSQKPEGRTQEELYGFLDPVPFADSAVKPDQYYSKMEQGITKYGVKAEPYATEEIVAQGLVENVQPGEVHKYTIVLWIEGYDPDCTDDIFGGFARYEMVFDRVEDDEDSSIFDGMYRNDYETTEATPAPPQSATGESYNGSISGGNKENGSGKKSSIPSVTPDPMPSSSP